MGFGGIEGQPRRVCGIGKDRALGERPGFRVHLKEVDALSIAVAAFRTLGVAVGADIGQNRAARRQGKGRGGGEHALDQAASGDH
jgi:hypothetical protein